MKKQIDVQVKLMQLAVNSL